MTWLAWRQHRTQILGLAAFFGALTLLYIALADPGMDPRSFLATVNSKFLDNLPALPSSVLFGMFVGAPLIALELEHRTYRFAWTQGISRTRWLWTKIALTSVAAIVSGVVFAAGYAWWRDALGITGFDGFDHGMLTFPMECLCSLALGILMGALFRRTLAAIVVSAVAFIALNLVLPIIRNYFYVAPITFRNRDQAPDHWYFVGTSMDYSIGYYQPPDRFWLFQFIEAGILLGITAACLGATWWWLRARFS